MIDKYAVKNGGTAAFKLDAIADRLPSKVVKVCVR
jgi:hypothetical protein